MENITKEKDRKQSNIRRNQLIKIKQAEWLRAEKELVNQKNALGYESLTLEEFLKIDITNITDTAKQSRIIDLQQAYKELQIKHEIIWAEDNVVNAFNKIHAVVHVEQTYILTEKNNTLGGQDFTLESRQSFKTFYEDETIICIDNTERSKADIWLKSPNRRKYKGILFDPRTTESKEGYYNLWKGFTKKAIQGDCSKYWSHVKDNICNENEEAYLFVRKWLAFVFQRPHIVHTALVLCGSQGVGKNSFVEPLGILLSSHYAPLSSIAELVSNFNYHLKNAVLIHANEALWGGNKKEIGTVKAMITEQTCLIEGKGKDRIVVKNFKHVILSSNEDWPVHLDPDDRRFCVLYVSTKHKEDHEYFKAIQNELDDGGYEALLYDLLNEDLIGFDPRNLPSSSNSFEIKMTSADSSYSYIYNVLCEGGFSIGDEDEDSSPVWQGPIQKKNIYQDYVNWCKKSGETVVTDTKFFKTLRKLISTGDTRPSGKTRHRCLTMPTLWQAQNDFSKAFKEKPEHIFDNYETSEYSPG